MTVERVVRLRCEMCGKRTAVFQDENEMMCYFLRSHWRSVRWDIYGNESHVCLKCGPSSKDDESIKEMLLAKAEN